jgi:hypothetical protein
MIALLPLLMFFGYGSTASTEATAGSAGDKKVDSTTLERMVVTAGSGVMNLDKGKLSGSRSRAKASAPNKVRFDIAGDSLFTVMVANDILRGPLPGMLPISAPDVSGLPAKMNTSEDLVLENLGWGGHFEFVIRDRKTRAVFFNVEGHEYNYDANIRMLSITGGRMLVSDQYAAELGRPALAGTIVGEISVYANLQTDEVEHMVNEETPSGENRYPEAGSRNGPDVVVGDVSGLAQFGSQSGTQVGLALGTDSCNFGQVNLNWFQNPSNDHPVIPQNLYRMSGGTDNTERFEQIGQSQVKHAFTALANNLCGLGCNGVSGSQLGSGCSDPYSASLNSGPSLGSKAWINPFTGVFPRNDSATPNNSHTSHTHLGPTHRILTEVNNLNTSLNAGATYYAEGQYVAPHEYVWCQANPGQCTAGGQTLNMNNNVSYRRYNVIGTASPFSFSPVGTTQREKPAILAWTGATFATIQPDPVNDGIGIVGYKVTNPSAGVWHYEYAVYNQNLDRAIQSFSVPVGNGATLSNVGFKAPPQHPGSTADGTVGNAGFSGTPWSGTQAGGAVTWASEPMATNANANAIRWGTLYNFRFDSNRPPQTVNATVGFFKNGSPITVQVQGPSPAAATGPWSVSGRVFDQFGNPVRNATVVINNSGGNTVGLATTSSLGNYTIVDVPGGSSYTIDVVSKRYTFNPMPLTVNSNLTGVNIMAVP